jgi:hypothetical protein
VVDPVVDRYIRRMPLPNVLVVAIDGLRASALGAYGNTTYSTPAFDRFAAQSWLLDACYAPTEELVTIYRALWHSAHPLRRSEVVAAEQSLPRIFSARGYKSTLVTDTPELLSVMDAGSFENCLQVATAESPSRATDPAQTSLANLFAAACDVIAFQRAARRLVWVHCCGMYGPWDAPIELQQALLDEGDPPPWDAVTPPNISLSNGTDPDVAFRCGCAYAAQVMVLDTCWKGLMEAVESSRPDEQWLVVLVGVRGFPLGEHGVIGGVDHRLYGEQLHVPWLVHFPDGRGALVRSHALTSHFDLSPTLIEGMDGDTKSPPGNVDGTSILPLLSSPRLPWRDWLLSTSSTGSKAIRTADWCLRQDAGQTSGPGNNAAEMEAELYVRPDDRWEANDVAKLCPDVVEQLGRTIEDLSRRLDQGRPLPTSISPTDAQECG